MEEPRNSNVAALRAALEELGLSTQGTSKVLKKRLRDFKKSVRQPPKQSPEISESQDKNLSVEFGEDESFSSRKRQVFDYFCVFDVEATCEEHNSAWTHEIIEFPVVLIDCVSFSVVAEFQSFVKPVLNPVLTPFCTALTGITQDQVSSAPSFPQVLRLFEAFLSRNKVAPARMCFCTDGPWDIRDFVATQCQISEMRIPSYFSRYVNVRRAFKQFYGHEYIKKRREKVNLQGMLRMLGMDFEGRPHSGIDDARNIARIVLRMLDEGCIFE